MKVVLLLLAMFCIFQFCSADLMTCSKEEQVKICLKGKERYTNPFPVVVETWLHLRGISDVNEDKNSISLQVELYSFWKDPGLDAPTE